MKKTQKLITISVAGLFLFASALLGQEQLSLTLERAIQLGIENSKSLHASSMKVRYADAKRSEANASRLPSLKASGVYTRLSNVPPFEISVPNIGKFTVNQSILDNYNLKLSLQQPIFTGFGLESRANAADYSAQAAEQDNKKDKTDLVYNVQLAYWNVYKATEFKKVVDENVDRKSTRLNSIHRT